MATTAEIEEFMHGPLVSWMQSCLNNRDELQSFEDLTSGMAIHQVLTLIDPEPVHLNIAPSMHNNCLKIRNMCCIIKNIKIIYEEELCQSLIMLPNCVTLGQNPSTKEGLENMKLLLMLLLGCAVQCPNKEKFIEKIKTMPVDCQHTLVPYIKQVTETQEIVLSSENREALTTDLLLTHVKRLLIDRDYYFQLWFSLFDEKRLNLSSELNSSRTTESPCQHLAVELADWKSKLRKTRQELEEKSESLVETKEELKRNSVLISKLRTEVQELKHEARVGKAYRDEVDALREKAERCDRLESDVIKYRERLGDLEFYRSRVDELRQDMKVMDETNHMLEEQLAKARKRAEYTLQLEGEIAQLRRTVDDVTEERDAAQEKLQEIIDENTQLKISNSSILANTPGNTINLDDSFTTGYGLNNNSLSDQLNSSSQTRILKSELENKRLQSIIDNLREASIHQNEERVLELEKEKKKLLLQIDNLEDTKKRSSQKICELENILKESQSHLKRVQELYELSQKQLEARCDEAEYSYKEKVRLEGKVSEMSLEIDHLRQEIDNKAELSEMQNKVTALEKEIVKLKRVIEENSMIIDKLSNENEDMQAEILTLKKQLEDDNVTINKYHELEKEAQDLHSRREMDTLTIKNLETDLVSEKLKSQQFRNCFDAIGLAVDSALDPETVLNSIVSNPDVLMVIREKISDSSTRMSPLNNAELQVNITTLQSQISSLASQHTALQLANSQLVAEKEETVKELVNLKTTHERLLKDQHTLQMLHEQLTVEYEALTKEKEVLKAMLKDGKAEKRNIQEKYTLLKNTMNIMEAEKENMIKDVQSLSNLRTEHSNLKDDFRFLYTANEKVKADYSALQEEYKKVRTEAGKYKLLVLELQGELAANTDKVASLEVEISKLSGRFEVLTKVNSGLEEDRRSLMEHISLLFTQYHDLLTHSMEDKEHYHSEEKNFVDKVNSLRRQKEKLEEKIMEQYRRLDNNPSKKKGFGASIVRRVKKAGSELIHKNRARSFHEDSLGRQQTDSESSAEDTRSRQTFIDMDDNLSCLSVPGTRRTLYLSGTELPDEDDTASTTSLNGHEDVGQTSENIRTSTPFDDPRTPVVVYNRLTAQVGTKSKPPSPTPTRHSNVDTTEPVDVNKIWHEYGCV